MLQQPKIDKFCLLPPMVAEDIINTLFARTGFCLEELPQYDYS